MESGSGQGLAVTLSYFSYNDGIERHIFNCTVLLSPPWRMTVCLVGSLSWNPGAGATSSMGELAGVQSLALRMELDLAAGIGDDLTEVIGLRRVVASPVEV